MPTVSYKSKLKIKELENTKKLLLPMIKVDYLRKKLNVKYLLFLFKKKLKIIFLLLINRNVKRS